MSSNYPMIYTITQLDGVRRVCRWEDESAAAEYSAHGNDPRTVQAGANHPAVIAANAEPHMQAQDANARAECNVR